MSATMLHERGLRVWMPIAAAVAVIGTSSSAQVCPDGYPVATLPLECEMGVATCFSGFVTLNPSSGINPDAFVVALVDFRDPPTNAPGTGQSWCAPMLHNEFPVTADTWSEKNLGQVFGVTVDDANPPNIYVTATTTFGSDDPSYQNGATTALAAPPFGLGGSGAVYQLSGTTGAISVFATLPNTGPGLGQIAHDRGFGAFYVSNFEDGRIYRISNAGTCLSTYDHATDGVGTCAPEAGDPAGFVPFGERVWAVKTLGDRLYYSLWNEDRGRQSAVNANEIWSVQLDGSGDFVGGTQQLEITLPVMQGTWSNPIADISFSSENRMMVAERNMRADVGAGMRVASASDGHRSRNLEYELSGGSWVDSGRLFRIGAGSGTGQNSSGGVAFDCDNNLWSTGDQLLYFGNPVQYIYGLQRTPEAGNTNATITTTGYFIDLDGIGSVQNKNRIGDVAVYNGCCDCMTVDVDDIECEFDATGLTGKYTVTATITNNSGVTAQYVLLPNVETDPNIIVLDPPLPSGTGETREITFQLCDLPPGTQHCFDIVLADEEVEECCRLEVCVDLPECDCIEFSDVEVLCDAAGNLSLTFTLSNLTSIPFEHLFFFPPLPPDPNSGVIITPDYIDLTSSPIPPFTSATIGPITITGAVPGTELCIRVSGHDLDLIECCSELLCFEVPDCDPTSPNGACCLPDGTCIVTTLFDCLIQAGLYLGDGVPCSQCGDLSPTGACCLADGTCVIVSAFECQNIPGDYAGDNTICPDDCEPPTPIGACCRPQSPCFVSTEAPCVSAGGTYFGDGSDCVDLECDGIGACCLPGAPCTLVSLDECNAVGGSWLGSGIPCEDCPPGFSPCDLNEDGSVGFPDLTILLSLWGPCQCPADINGDGDVGFTDLVELLAQWDS